MAKLNWKMLGPGIVLAAAGVGAGDIIANGTAGASHGMILMWAIILGAFLKYMLNEGMARYQLATNKTFIKGINDKSKWLNFYFLVYLVIWSFVVGGALLSSAGVVTQAIFSGIPVWALGILNAILVLGIIFFGNYKIFEKIMKFFALIMFVSFFITAIILFPDFISFLKGFVPVMPPAETFWKTVFDTLAIIGGVGGTVTIMAYSYWIREKGWTKKADKKIIKTDLAVGYIITAIFGISVMIVAASVLHPQGIELSGKEGIIMLAETLTTVLGPWGFWVFILGFYSAVVSSLFSFYQAIPYLFADSVSLFRKKPFKSVKELTGSPWYKGYIIYNAIPPMILLWFSKPILLVKSFTVLGAFFMPYLALMLLILNNNKNEMKELKNSMFVNVVLVFIFLMFAGISLWKFI